MTISDKANGHPALDPTSGQRERIAYALLRLALGIVILTHGLPKALGMSHGSMADPMTSSINLMENVMGLPFAPQLAVMVMLLETGGAVMLAIGVYSRAVAALLAAEMAGISYALAPTWVWVDRGIEYPVLMGVLAFYIAVRGSGHYSVDQALLRLRTASVPVQSSGPNRSA